MPTIQRLLSSLILLSPIAAWSQSAYFPQGSKENILLERLEIKAQRDTALNFSHIKPFNRKWYVKAIDRLEDDPTVKDALTPTDRYNIERARMNNLEWVEGDKSAYRSRKPLWNTFYKTPANLIEVDQPDFFLAVNPVLQLNYIYDDAGGGENRFLNTRGFVARGLVSKRFGFQTYLTENQERAPQFVQDRINLYRAVPGADRHKPFKNKGVDYWDARGSFMFNAAKYLDIQFGYDRTHIGNGYRSLFFSEQSGNHLFLNLNLRVWRLNYMSRVMELTPQYTKGSMDTLLPKKYMAMHYISFTAPKWLTLGLFQGVVFGRQNHFEFGYLNPIIFLRPIEYQIGSPDNALIGLDAKANILKRFQLYGQLMLDEFLLSAIRERSGSWVNKWSLQAGVKHVDLFGVKNLDLQLEANLIRPFTYSHRDTIANYTHNNQPLAHPLMSNVQEFIGILRYQPAPKWYLQGRMIYWNGGSDVNGENWGNNIFRDYSTRAADEGIFFGAKEKTRWMNANLWAAYEWRENFFIELNASARKAPDRDLNLFGSVGLRWNMHRRDYDY